MMVSVKGFLSFLPGPDAFQVKGHAPNVPQLLWVRGLGPAERLTSLRFPVGSVYSALPPTNSDGKRKREDLVLAMAGNAWE